MEGMRVTHHCVGHLLISNLFKLQSQLLPFSTDGDAHFFPVGWLQPYHKGGGGGGGGGR